MATPDETQTPFAFAAPDQTYRNDNNNNNNNNAKDNEMKCYVYRDPAYAPCGFLLVRDGADPYSDDPADTILVQRGLDFPGLAANLGYVPCCGVVDGPIGCKHKTAGEIIGEAYDYIMARLGERFDDPGYFGDD